MTKITPFFPDTLRKKNTLKIANNDSALIKEHPFNLPEILIFSLIEIFKKNNKSYEIRKYSDEISSLIFQARFTTL